MTAFKQLEDEFNNDSPIIDKKTMKHSYFRGTGIEYDDWADDDADDEYEDDGDDYNDEYEQKRAMAETSGSKKTQKYQPN